jgi:hypothetical protein
MGEMVLTNNVLAQPICFNCIKKTLNYNSLTDANRFCRTYNIPFEPELWMKMAASLKENTFKEYMAAQYGEGEKPNYIGSTDDVWAKADGEWDRLRRFSEILAKIAPLKESYTERQRLAWGSQYSFEELIKLDSLYIRSIQANNIVNPLQRESLRTLLKVMADMDNAITLKDATELKNLASTYKTLAATAQLSEMIEKTKTDDITTLAEVAETLEANGFIMPYYHGEEKDAIDVAIKNIQESNRYTILNATGLGELVQQIADKRNAAKQSEVTEAATKETSIDDLQNEYMTTPEDLPDESDEDITKQDFSDELDKR